TKTYFQEAARPAAIIGSADVYVGEFGTYSVVPNRFQRDRDCWILDFEYVQIAYLRPFKVEELAKTGDAEKRFMVVEWGLIVATDFAHGLVADLLTSSPAERTGVAASGPPSESRRPINSRPATTARSGK